MKLLDLYCGAGGGAMGYYRAGFTSIVGVDLVNQKHYPFEFVRSNVLDLEVDFLREFDVIHASPPCQAYGPNKHNLAWYFPDIMEETRELLLASGKPYIIENIPQAPLINPILLCGTMFPELRVIRHRLFESNFPIGAPFHLKKNDHPIAYSARNVESGIVTDDPWNNYVTVVGGGTTTVECAKDAMGIDWPMFKREVNEAIPPAYTEYLGRQIIVLKDTHHKEIKA